MKEFQLSDRKIKTNLPAFVMGIVNVTPDSFWEDSRGGIERALELIQQGADILDIGGESSRPGADYISKEEEIKRLIPVITEIRKNSNCPISVDTRKSVVMKAALDAGADILNDISALEDDSDMVRLAADTKIPVIIMHKRGIPVEMQKNTEYEDAFDEVNTYLSQRADFAIKNGIKKNKIILDPGIGFGKNLDANCVLIKKCGKLCNSEYPVLMALSRKTCIGQITGREVKDRLPGTLAANMLAVINGAYMIRVHDVKPAIDTLNILNKLKSGE